jgi:hypothetical protein
MIRIRNPETIYASWSSSGPVQAQIDMSSYWKAAERSLPRNCSNDWIAVTQYVYELFQNGSVTDIFDLKSALITAEYSGPGGNTTLIHQDGFLSTSYVDETNVANAASWLMDPLGSFQVSLFRVQAFFQISDSPYSIMVSSRSFLSAMSFKRKISLLQYTLTGFTQISVSRLLSTRF